MGKRVICKITKWKKRKREISKSRNYGEKIGKKRVLGKEKIRKIEIWETGEMKIMYNKGE